MRIKESELILKNDKIYHLGLDKDDLADVVITVGDPQRVKHVTKHFDKREQAIQKREFITQTGEIGGKRITVIGTGIGPDNIDILLNEIDAVKNIDFNSRSVNNQKKSLTIIRLGTSGALQKEIDVDSLIASSHGFGLDGLLNFYNYKESDFQTSFLEKLKNDIPSIFDICYPYIFPCADELINTIGKDYYKGITITAGGFYGPQGRELRIPQKMRTIIDSLVSFRYDGLRFSNFEMETSSIYGLSDLLNHKALSVNAIIANRANGTFSKDIQKTIDKMITQVLERICTLL